MANPLIQRAALVAAKRLKRPIVGCSVAELAVICSLAVGWADPAITGTGAGVSRDYASVVWLEFTLVSLLALVGGGASIADERRRGTWDALCLTDLTGSELARGKLLATLLDPAVRRAAGCPGPSSIRRSRGSTLGNSRRCACALDRNGHGLGRHRDHVLRADGQGFERRRLRGGVRRAALVRWSRLAGSPRCLPHPLPDPPANPATGMAPRHRPRPTAGRHRAASRCLLRMQPAWSCSRPPPSRHPGLGLRPSACRSAFGKPPAVAEFGRSGMIPSAGARPTTPAPGESWPWWVSQP